MVRGRSLSSVIWRTVVCVALVPGCRKPAAEEAAAEAREPKCSELEPLPEQYAEVPEPPPGDVTDGRFTIFVTSTPSGALVRVDGEDRPRGRTPVEVVLEVDGTSTMLFVELEGHETASPNFDLSVEGDRAVSVNLLDSAMLAARPSCPPDHVDFGFIVS